MRRQLITLFALFTGLAALHAPAQASALESLVFDARAFARANDTATSVSCQCQHPPREGTAKCPSRDRQRAPARLPNSLRPTIVFGSERALE
ncbi:hypothetical protein [Erythrobacter sp. Alg231-14]|uniref:hypothetical protein n=1 Tax=Erythrobacter sp. Alg231-14 TaxID=1922225 RepID=UPI000D5501A1